jgi:hypothetical protein
MLPVTPLSSPVVFKTIAVIGKYMAAGIEQSLSDLASFLVKRGHCPAACPLRRAAHRHQPGPPRFHD